MIDIIIPIFNEDEQIIKLLKKIKIEIKIKKNIYLCYDDDQDNVFNYKKVIQSLNDEKFKIFFLKNPERGPCTAVVTACSIALQIVELFILQMIFLT